MEIDINNSTNFKINRSLLEKIAKKILKNEDKEGYNVSIVFVDRKIIKEINKKYRNKDQTTDVLSFAYLESINFPKEETIGEIFICPSEIKEGELIKTMIHGILHLLGYDHEKNEKERKIMEEKEKEYLFLYPQK